MANDACRSRLSVGRVILERVVLVIESNFAPLVVEAIGVELNFLWLLFTLFRNLLLKDSRGACRAAENQKRGRACQNDETDEQSLHNIPRFRFKTESHVREMRIVVSIAD